MHSKQTREAIVKPGEIVTIQDSQKKNRIHWNLGRVEGVIKSHDAIVRGIKIRLAKGKIIELPLQKVFPLEILVEEAPRKQTENVIHSEPRPKGKATSLANERIHIINNIEQLEHKSLYCVAGQGGNVGNCGNGEVIVSRFDVFLYILHAELLSEEVLLK